MRTLARVAMASLVLAAGLLVTGCKNESPPATKSETPAPAKTPEGAPAPAPAPVPIAQKLCPVTGDPIDPKIYIDYNGRRVYFCCEMCPPVFKKDPEKYLKKLDEQMGIKTSAAKESKSATATPPTEQKIYYWTCQMHPEVRSDKSGNCPKCGMTLAPVTEPPKGPGPK